MRDRLVNWSTKTKKNRKWDEKLIYLGEKVSKKAKKWWRGS